ncbi:serine/threonine-protein kinase ATG1c isoform X2 [Hevea brasiliensis]|nr:serine/threonine-protein kinase ATG1c isoform X2 [Hevea brasiliensis]
MAPEIMQLQKYDAKADLWSVGAILFQLVTGKTPFTGNNQIELLQNIMKSTELQFPSDIKDLSADCKDLCQKLLRRNPVERLTFEEFFNHPFLSQRKIDQSLGNRTFLRSVDSVPLSESISARNTENISPEDYLPFFLDDDSSGPEGSPSFSKRKPSMKSTYGFSLDTQVDGKEAKSNALNNKDFTPRHSSHNLEFTSFKPDINKFSNEYLHEAPKSMNQMSMNLQSRAVDSLELIDQDYVLVSGPPLDVSSSSGSTSKPSHVPHKSPSPPESSGNLNTVSMPIIGTANSHIGSLEDPGSAPGTSQGSTDIGDVLEQPSTHCMSRIKSLQQCASAISELVREKMEVGRQLEAFSIQLVILAIWKQALHICHTEAASAIEGSPSQESPRLRRSSDKKHGTPDTEDGADVGPENISTQIEREFLREVEHAEELAKAIEPGNIEMPDAMETIFQSALALGKLGGVAELMREMESASFLYSKAVRLFVFLLAEAPSLIFNPPFSLTNSDRYRLRTYIHILNNRQGHSVSKDGTSQCDE